MDQGVIAQRGTPDELYERPSSAFVAGFMGEAMLFDGMADGEGMVALGPLAVRHAHAPLRGPVKVAVRPEAWVIRPATTEGLPARVVKRTYVGSVMEYTLASALGEIFVVSPEVKQRLHPGAPVSLHLADHGVSVVAAA
jgi:iron(III) transport system ATP-binding protein